MKKNIKNIIFLIVTSLVLSFCSIYKTPIIIEGVSSNITRNIKNLTNNHSTTYTEDLSEIFSRALTNYCDTFDNYIDIRAINVCDKTMVNLPNFDPDYVPPTFSEILYDYHLDMIESFSYDDFDNFESLREVSFELDQFSTLNENGYLDLEAPLKYDHSGFDNVFNPDPIVPPPFIDPVFPFNPINPDSMNLEINSVSVVGLNVLFAGISETAMVGISAATGAIGVALSSTSIPIVGWVIAVAILVAALIAITVIIVENWDVIKENIGPIENWYATEFPIFESHIDTYFDDVYDKGKETTIIEKVQIGSSYYDVISQKYASIKAMYAAFSMFEDNYEDVMVYRDAGKSNNIFYMNQIDGCHDERFVVQNKIYDLGYSTYTFSADKTRRMMMEGCTLNSYSTPNCSFIVMLDYLSDHVAPRGFNHYHYTTVDEDGVVDTKRTVIKTSFRKYFRCHGFFGYPLSNVE